MLKVVYDHDKADIADIKQQQSEPHTEVHHAITGKRLQLYCQVFLRVDHALSGFSHYF